MSYDAILFDNDGVLTYPTERAVIKTAIRETLAEFGVTDPCEAQLDQLVSIDVPTLEGLCDNLEIDTAAFWAQREANVSAAQRQAIRDGTKPLYMDVELLHSLDIPCGIVSNNQHPTIEYLVNYFDLTEVFQTYYGRKPTLQGLRNKKPNPHYVEKAIADVDAQQPLFVGDSASDIEVARHIGIDSVFLRRPHRETYQLAREPTYEYETFEELLRLV